MRHTLRLTALAVAGLLTLGACGGGDGDSANPPAAAQAATTTLAPATSPPTTSAAATTTTPTTAAAPATTSAPTTTVVKVSANNASRAEMTAAFTANGISNPSRWAMEVEEYRPYPTNDPTMAKLRQNLAKYNPGPGVVDAIVASLSL